MVVRFALLLNLALLLGAGLLLTACGRDHHAVSTRHHMGDGTHIFTWDSELKQLPWQPPALGDTHYPRSGSANYEPGNGSPPRIVGQETHADQRWRSGRRALPTDDRVKH